MKYMKELKRKFIIYEQMHILRAPKSRPSRPAR